MLLAFLFYLSIFLVFFFLPPHLAPWIGWFLRASLWDAQREVQRGAAEPFSFLQEGECGCQICSLHPVKDSAMGGCGFKPSSGAARGLPPLLGHQGFSHEEKGTPRATSEAK